MESLIINNRCRLLGELDFNPRREAPIRDGFTNGECVSKEHEIYRIYTGVCLELGNIYATYPWIEFEGLKIVKIPELCFLLSKLEIP